MTSEQALGTSNGCVWTVLTSLLLALATVLVVGGCVTWAHPGKARELKRVCSMVCEPGLGGTGCGQVQAAWDVLAKRIAADAGWRQFVYDTASGTSGYRGCAVGFLVLVNDGRVPTIALGRIKDPRTDVEEKASAILALTTYRDPRGVDEVVRLIPRGGHLRDFGLQYLGAVSDARAHGALRAFVVQPAYQVSWGISALGQSRDPLAAPILTAMLARTPRRPDLVAALAQVPTPEAEAVVTRWLREAEPGDKAQACRQIAEAVDRQLFWHPEDRAALLALRERLLAVQ